MNIGIYNHGKLIIVLLVCMMEWSCKEVYYPDEIISNEKIPVIQGLIVEDGSPEATLSWALGYKEQSTEYINDARVYVTDDEGNSEDLTSVGNGKYNGFTGEIIGTMGRTYTLHVELPDGKTYASKPETIARHPVVDSLYASPVLQTFNTYNSSNEPISEVQEGLSLKADLSGSGDSSLYYRFHTKVVKETMYTVGIGTPGSYSVFGWQSYTIDKSYSSGISVTQGLNQVLKDHDIGFVRYYYDVNLETQNSTAPYTIAWILTCDVYSISQDVYNYYQSIEKQLNSSDQMFAPEPSQIKGNVQCENNPDEKVIGIFEASSKTTAYRAFGWESLTKCYHKDLDYFPPDVTGGSVDRFPPSFWINFQ